jgi:hypothetical protein
MFTAFENYERMLQRELDGLEIFDSVKVEGRGASRVHYFPFLEDAAIKGAVAERGRLQSAAVGKSMGAVHEFLKRIEPELMAQTDVWDMALVLLHILGQYTYDELSHILGKRLHAKLFGLVKAMMHPDRQARMTMALASHTLWAALSSGRGHAV